MDRLAELEAENAELRAKLAAMEAALRNSVGFQQVRAVVETQSIVVARLDQIFEVLPPLQDTARRQLQTLMQIGVE